MYDLYIFDLDGTLIDTMPDVYATVEAVSKQLNLILPTLEETELAVGWGFHYFVEQLFAKNHPDRVEEIYEAIYSHYKEHSFEKSKPFPGAVALVAELSKSTPCVVLTNKTSTLAKIIIPRVFGNTMKEVFGAEDVPAIKPDPSGMRMIIEKYGAKHPLFIGDSTIDIETAQSADVPIAIYTEGYNHGKDLSGATFQVSNLLDVINIV